jgi:protocatechuate 3,4-dioxygenase beta subunit
VNREEVQDTTAEGRRQGEVEKWQADAESRFSKDRQMAEAIL